MDSLKWVVELIDGTSIYHEGSLHYSVGSTVVIAKPVIRNMYVHILYEKIDPADIMSISTTELTPEELTDMGVNFRIIQ